MSMEALTDKELSLVRLYGRGLDVSAIVRETGDEDAGRLLIWLCGLSRGRAQEMTRCRTRLPGTPEDPPPLPPPARRRPAGRRTKLATEPAPKSAAAPAPAPDPMAPVDALRAAQATAQLGRFALWSCQPCKFTGPAGHHTVEGHHLVPVWVTITHRETP